VGKGTVKDTPPSSVVKALPLALLLIESNLVWFHRNQTPKLSAASATIEAKENTALREEDVNAVESAPSNFHDSVVSLSQLRS
jgi:hypothetical protein